MSQFLELLSPWRRYQFRLRDVQRGQISEVWQAVFLWFKALPRGFRRRTEKNNEKYPESEQSLSGAAHLLGNLGTFWRTSQAVQFGPFRFPKRHLPRKPAVCLHLLPILPQAAQWLSQFCSRLASASLLLSLRCVCQQWRRRAQDGRICSATVTTCPKTHQTPALVSSIGSQIQ